jgi:hypothetical protein
VGLEICDFSSEQIWYPPDVGDNREQPEEDQFAVLVQPATSRELQRLDEQHGTARGKKINFIKRYHEIREAILVRCIKEVRNCTYRNANGETHAITTGKELAAKAGNDILEDILEAIKDHSKLTEEALGKSERRSGSSSTPRPISNGGGAPSATPKSSPTTQETQGPTTQKSVSPIPSREEKGTATASQQRVYHSDGTPSLDGVQKVN